MPKYCYIKVSKDKYKHIVAIGDSMKELADQIGVLPAAIELGLSRGSPIYERVLIDDSDDDYKKHTCKECIYLNCYKKAKQGYICENTEKAWNKGSSRIRKAADCSCKCFEYNENWDRGLERKRRKRKN